MSGQEKDEALKTFCEISNLSADDATRYLDMYNWEIEAALQGYYAEEPMVSVDDENQDIVEIPVNRNENVTESNSSNRPIQQQSSSRPQKQPKNTRFGTIGNFKQDDEQSSDSDSNNRESFFAGGSETSGQQILGQPKKNKDFVKNIFKSARDHGAVEVDISEQASNTESGAAFCGTGYRLGESTSETSEKISGQRLKKNITIILKMYKNGFLVSGEDNLRQYNDPDDEKFLKEILTGRIPQELINRAEGGKVNLDMEDHRQEEYEFKKKPRVKAFCGAGHALGSETSPTTSDARIAPSTISIDSSVDQVRKPKVDESKPTTNIQIRLQNGRRLTAMLNQDQTIGDVKDYIRSEQTEYLNRNFSLMTSFPNKVYKEDNQNLKELGLCGSVLIQKLE